MTAEQDALALLREALIGIEALLTLAEAQKAAEGEKEKNES